jgi:transposase-like protein
LVETTRSRDGGGQTTVEEPERRGGERSEASRSGGSSTVERVESPAPAAPDPEVPARHARRRFTPQYKLEILRRAEACSRPGQLGELLRKEGLYSSHLITWRRQREEGLTPKKRGRKAVPVDPRVKKLEQENRRLERRLKKAEAIIAFQKKVHELLGIPLKPFESEEDD